jgi:hypothetical protein
MKKFEPILLNFVNVWLAMTVFFMSFAVALEGPFPQWGYFWILITLSMMIPQLSKFTVKRLIIDRTRNIVMVEWRKWFFVTRKEEHPIATVRAEVVNELNKMGGKREVFRIFVNNKEIAELPTRFTGWKSEIAFAFISELIG